MALYVVNAPRAPVPQKGVVRASLARSDRGCVLPGSVLTCAARLPRRNAPVRLHTMSHKKLCGSAMESRCLANPPTLPPHQTRKTRCGVMRTRGVFVPVLFMYILAKVCVGDAL